MWKIDLILLSAFMVMLVSSASISEKEDDHHKRVRRDGGLTAAIVGAAISAGASLAGTTVSALQAPGYSIAVSGSIENYARWPLNLKTCELARGYMNKPMRTVAPGFREGFASHKNGHTATGSWVRCSFTMNKATIHLMYAAPYNFNHYSNTMAFAVCPSNDSTCISLDAKVLYYNSNSYIARRSYYYSVATLKKCGMGICVTGVMGTNHRAEIDIKVMPEKYDDLSAVAKDSSVKDRWSKKDYERFIASQ